MSDEQVRDDVRDACRILALFGVLNDVVGHVSARPSDDEVLLRCRTPDEEGLLFTRSSQVASLAFKEGRVYGDQNGPTIPIEWPIHAAIYEARPDIGAVVHAHPPGALMCGLAGVEVLPMRVYDYAPIRVILEGVPTYPSAAMIDRPERAEGLVAALGDKHVCLMRGHGIVATGATVREATIRAIAYESAARMTWRLANSGREIIHLSAEEIGDSSGSSSQGDTAAAVHDGWADWSWRYYRRLLAERDAGRMVPVEKGWP
ncbi:class II aldolase/adducin family protein [Rugosimonospora acidiphila]|uniref:Class II aldolase/adducin family protein n=1 Tax=Rugosimonospora acidiphila TaxID=556531 RepID=A0ABP9SRC1_9ACTN